MTQQQVDIINNLIGQFDKVNSKYFDITPLVEEKRKIDDEKRKHLDVFNATLKANVEIVKAQFCALANDLSVLGEMQIFHDGSQIKLLTPRGELLIRCLIYPTYIMLSDAKTRCEYGVKPKYSIYHRGISFREFDSFEELVESPTLKTIIQSYL